MNSISHSNLILRWAYLFEGVPYEIRQVDLCSIFWRSILLTPLKLAGILAVISVCCEFFFVLPIRHWEWWGLLVFPGVVGFIFLINRLHAWEDDQFYGYTRPNLIIEALRGFKNRYCPIIKIDDSE